VCRQSLDVAPKKAGKKRKSRFLPAG